VLPVVSSRIAQVGNLCALQKVKGKERVACNLLGLLSSIVPPLRPAEAASSGVLVALGLCRTDCPRPVAGAARALHARLQQRSATSSAAAAIGAAGAQGASTAGERRAKDAAIGAKMESAAHVLPPSKADAKPVIKYDDKGLIQELDEETLKQLPPEEVRMTLPHCCLLLQRSSFLRGEKCTATFCRLHTCSSPYHVPYACRTNCSARSLLCTLQAQAFREKVARLRAALRPADDAAHALADLRQEERASGAAKHEGFNAFLKDYNAAAKGGSAVAAKPSRALKSAKADRRGNGKADKAQRDRSRHAKPGHHAQNGAGGDSKVVAAYKAAVCDVVKAELKAALALGAISKEQFKQIAQRATEKVVSTSQARSRAPACHRGAHNSLCTSLSGCLRHCIVALSMLSMPIFLTEKPSMRAFAIQRTVHVLILICIRTDRFPTGLQRVQGATQRSAEISDEKRSKICRLVSKYVDQARKR
jgi:hypothetical protein